MAKTLFLLSLLLLSHPAWAADDCLSVGCHQAFAALTRVHAPVAAGNCRVCHLPHGESPANLLTAPLPELCLGCHPEVDVAFRLAKVRHAPLYRERSCLECHAAHASTERKLLAAPQQELCLDCHGRDDYSKSKVLRNIGREMQGQKQMHGPLAAGECTPCHAPHGSDYYRLLDAPYPPSIYAEFQPDSYAFCFGCHDRALLLETAAITGFRDGQRNLHRLHVVAPRKGRTCHTCHASHAGGEHLLIEDGGAAFGGWQIPLRVELTATGGRCLVGCHVALTYDRDSPQPSP